MVTLQLTDTEARLLARLLDMAGDTYANHGCNDFDLRRELKLSPADAQKVAQELRASMRETKCCEEEDLGSTSPYFLDWLLMRHFQARVEALLPTEQKGPRR